MKHLLTLFDKIVIHPFTYLYMFLAIISNSWIIYFPILLIVFLHELSHYFVACLFHFKIGDIHVLPFGLYVEILDYGLRESYYEYLIAVAGIVMQMIIHVTLSFFYQSLFVQYLIYMNKLIMIFNCLPIYPLDGYCILLLFLENIIDMKLSYYYSFSISLISLLLFTYFFHTLRYFVILYFLYYVLFTYYQDLDVILERAILLQNFKKRGKIIHKHPFYLRNKENFYIFNDIILNDNEFLSYYTKKYR